jgi:hypothetical protein
MELSSKMHKIFYIFFAFILYSCAPYVDAKREAGVTHFVGQSKGSDIAICYNPIFNDQSEIENLAKKTCNATRISFQNTKYFNCSLFYPNTIFYKCPPEQKESKK